MEKFGIITIFGIVSGTLAQFFGGWSEAMTTLCVFMVIDYITGLIVAGVFKKSHKTENGGLESKAGFKGLCRKFSILILVLIACRLDMLLGTNFIKECVIFTFLANESLSITENIGLMGVPLPKQLTKAISILNEKGNKEHEF